MKKRRTNDWPVYCSSPACETPDVLINTGAGYYLGKRGKNGTDYYLCQSCDTTRKILEAKRKENRKAIEQHQTELANKRAERLHKKTGGGSCDCIE